MFMDKYRNSQKRIYLKDVCYFVTSKTFNNFPYFKESIFCDLFMENLRLCKQLKGFLLYGWVLVYDHFHLIVQPNDKWDISDVMFSIKKQFSHDVNLVIGFNKLYSHLKAGKRLPAFMGDDELLSAKHQKFIYLLKQQFIQKCKNQNPFPKFQWQDKFHDHYIRNENDFDYHMEYIAYNPTKHKMPYDWPYIYTRSKYDDFIDDCL